MSFWKVWRDKCSAFYPPQKSPHQTVGRKSVITIFGVGYQPVTWDSRSKIKMWWIRWQNVLCSNFEKLYVANSHTRSEIIKDPCGVYSYAQLLLSYAAIADLRREGTKSSVLAKILTIAAKHGIRWRTHVNAVWCLSGADSEAIYLNRFPWLFGRIVPCRKILKSAVLLEKHIFDWCFHLAALIS